MNNNDVSDVRNTVQERGIQIAYRYDGDGSQSLTPIERDFFRVFSVLNLGDDDTWEMWIGHTHPRELLATAAFVGSFGGPRMVELFRAVFNFHATPGDFEKPWSPPKGMEAWGAHVANRMAEFDYPTAETLLPPPLRGNIKIGQYVTDPDTPISGSLRRLGHTPDSWRKFKGVVERGGEPEFYENWYRQHRGAPDDGISLRYHSFRDGWYVDLPNPWNGVHGASTALAKMEPGFLRALRPWVETHASEVRIYDASLRYATEEQLRKYLPGFDEED